MKLWTLCGVLGVALLCYGSSNDQGGTANGVQCLHNELRVARFASPRELSQGRDDKDNGQMEEKAMEYMVMLTSIAKGVLSTLITIITPVIQAKALGVALVNTIVNLWRFLIQLKESQAGKDQANVVPSYGSQEPSVITDFREYDDSLDRSTMPYPFSKGVLPYPMRITKPYVGGSYQSY